MKNALKISLLLGLIVLMSGTVSALCAAVGLCAAPVAAAPAVGEPCHQNASTDAPKGASSGAAVAAALRPSACCIGADRLPVAKIEKAQKAPSFSPDFERSSSLNDLESLPSTETTSPPLRSKPGCARAAFTLNASLLL